MVILDFPCESTELEVKMLTDLKRQLLSLLTGPILVLMVSNNIYLNERMTGAVAPKACEDRYSYGDILAYCYQESLDLNVFTRHPYIQYIAILCTTLIDYTHIR
jgi:hypothetical protein